MRKLLYSFVCVLCAILMLVPVFGSAESTTYTIHYDGNGATSGNDYDQLNVPVDTATRLYVHDFSKKGNRFTGWNTEADGSGTGYEEQAEVTGLAEAGGTVILYAQWTTEGVYQAESLGNGKYRIPVKMGETIVIPDLPAGVHYEVREVSMPAGWSFEKAMNGEDDSDENYSYGIIEANGVASATMVNRYSAQGSLNIAIYKELLDGMTEEQVDPAVGQFEFELYKIVGDEEQKVGSSSNDAANDYHLAQVRFDALTFTEADIGNTYTYVIREVNVPEGFEADSDVQVEVTVNDEGDGTLSFTLVMNHMRQDPANPDDLEAKISVFTNKDQRHGKLKIIKNVVGNYEAGETFEFHLTLTDNGDLYEQPVSGSIYDGEQDTTTAQTWTADNGEYLINIGANGYVELDLPSGLNYSVTEAEKPGWSQLGAIGTEDTIEIGVEKEATFSNSFNPDGILILDGTKILTGRALEKEEFMFIISDENGNSVSTGTNAAAEYDEDANTSTGEIKFTAIPYTAEDIGQTFVYTVKEYKPATADSSLVYDETSVYTLSVTVGIENGEMTFDVEIVDEMHNVLTDGEKMTFENEFYDVTEITIDGVKQLQGRDFIESDEWVFTLNAVDGGPMPTEPEVVLHPFEDAEFQFTIQFSGADLVDNDGNRVTTKDFHYTITETGDVAEIKNDAEPKNVTIRVTSLSGALSATIVEEDTDELVWRNVLGVRLPGTGSLEALWFALAGLAIIAIGLVIRRKLLRQE